MKLKLNFFLLFFVFGILIFSFVSAAEYQLKRASELQVGDIIVGSDGKEIVVERIESSVGVQERFVREETRPLREVIWESIAGRSLPEPVVSGGSSELGLSLGEKGVGIMLIGEATAEIVQPKIEERESFWDRLFFWRRR